MVKKTDKKTEQKRPDKILPPKSDIVFKLLFGDERSLDLRTERREELEMLPRNNPDINKAVGRLLELSADDKARRLYEARERARRDEASRIKTARRMGLEEGEARGIAKGETKERISIAKNLLGLSLPLADIAKATGLPLAKIKKLHYLRQGEAPGPATDAKHLGRGAAPSRRTFRGFAKQSSGQNRAFGRSASGKTRQNAPPW
jgi:hypothetical protein